MPDEIGLDETRKSQLDKNIRGMLEGGASNDDVLAYATDFKSKFGTKKKTLGQGLENGLDNFGSGGKNALNSLINTPKPEIPTVLVGKEREKSEAPIIERQKGYQQMMDAYDGAQGEGASQRIQSLSSQKQADTISPKVAKSFTKSASNSVSNLVTSLKGVLPRAALTSNAIVEKIVGRENAVKMHKFMTYNPFTGESNDDLIGGSYEEIESNVINELDYLETQTRPTEGLVDNIRNFNVPGLAAATFDAVSSLAGTAIPSILSGGTALATDMVGGSLHDYNSAKAKSKGLTTDELYKKGEADFYAPALVGSLGFGMEKIGLKGISSAINRQVAGKGFKTALLLANDLNKEGATEWMQVGLDEANIAIANGLSIEDAAIAAKDAMFSARGLEAYAKGFVGSGVAAGGGRVAKSLLNSKNKKEAVKLEEQQAKAWQDLANDNIPTEAKEAIVTVLENNAEKINDLAIKDSNESEALTPEQKAVAQEINTKIDTLEETIANPSVSDSTKEALKEQVKELEKELKEVPRQETVGETSQEVAEQSLSGTPESQTTESIPEGVQGSPVSQQQEATTEMQGIGDGSFENGTVKVKSFKKGDGGTKGIFEDESGKLYKSTERTQAVLNAETNQYERQVIPGSKTNEYDILSELQGNPHIPKIGKAVETSEGKAFEIEKLNELESISKEEFAQVEDILADLNSKGYFVNDVVTVMRRPKTGEIVVVDFSSGMKDESLIGNYSFKDNVLWQVEEKLSAKDKDKVKLERIGKIRKQEAEDFLEDAVPNQYILTQRPPSIGTHPTDGLKSVEEIEFNKRKAWKLIYDQPLSEKDIYSYELREPLDEKALLGEIVTHRVAGDFVIDNVADNVITLTRIVDGKEESENISAKEFQNNLKVGRYKFKNNSSNEQLPTSTEATEQVLPKQGERRNAEDDSKEDDKTNTPKVGDRFFDSTGENVVVQVGYGKVLHVPVSKLEVYQKAEKEGRFASANLDTVEDYNDGLKQSDLFQEQLLDREARNKKNKATEVKKGADLVAENRLVDEFIGDDNSLASKNKKFNLTKDKAIVAGGSRFKNIREFVEWATNQDYDTAIFYEYFDKDTKTNVKASQEIYDRYLSKHGEPKLVKRTYSIIASNGVLKELGKNAYDYFNFIKSNNNTKSKAETAFSKPISPIGEIGQEPKVDGFKVLKEYEKGVWIEYDDGTTGMLTRAEYVKRVNRGEPQAEGVAVEQDDKASDKEVRIEEITNFIPERKQTTAQLIYGNPNEGTWKTWLSEVASKKAYDKIIAKIKSSPKLAEQTILRKIDDFAEVLPADKIEEALDVEQRLLDSGVPLTGITYRTMRVMGVEEYKGVKIDENYDTALSKEESNEAKAEVSKPDSSGSPLQKTETDSGAKEAKKEEPTVSKKSDTVNDTPNDTVTKSKRELATEARKAAKAKLDALNSNLSIANDPKEKAKAFFDYHVALVAEAKEYISEGMESVQDFAVVLGEKVSKVVQDAWDEATGVSKKTLADFEKEQSPVTEKVSDGFKSLVHKNIQSEEVNNTLNNIERETGRELTLEEKQYKVTKLQEALNHGTEVVESSKSEFGDGYVSAVLDYLNENQSTISVENKSLITIALELDLERQLQAEPDNKLTLEKQLKLVRDISMAQQRSAAIAVGYGRLRQIARVGYDISQFTDLFYSEKQLEYKTKIEKALQSNTDEINKEAEAQEQDAINEGIEKAIAEGVEKRIAEIYEALPSNRRQSADKAIAVLDKIQKRLRAKTYDATIGVPVAIIDAGITTIKAAIRAGVNVADAIELGIARIKEKHGKAWAKEGEFRKDMLAGFKAEGVDLKDGKSVKNPEAVFVKEALIEAGFGREITVKTKNGKEKRTIIDWKKLAGAEGSIENIQKHVETHLKAKGYSDTDIASMQKALVEEYTSLRASIVEKALNELEKGNTPSKKANIRSSALRLAELYNFGLMEKDVDTYEHLVNKALGVSIKQQALFDELKVLAQALVNIYASKDANGKRLPETAVRNAVRVVNKKIEDILRRSAWAEGITGFKIASVVAEYMNLAQRNMLVTVKQNIENVLSGNIAKYLADIGYMAISGKKDNKALVANRKELQFAVFKDIILNGGQFYGDISTPLLSKSTLEDKINSLSDSKLYHAAISTITGRAFLEGADSLNKSYLTEKYFQHNLIKVLTSPSNPSRMSKQDAIAYVAEKLTGQSLNEAKGIAGNIIDRVNFEAGNVVLPKNKESITRLAHEVVNIALVNGGKISQEQVDASYNSAYKAAGFDLGHEANNPISIGVSSISSRIETQTQQAIKEKRWIEAASLTFAGIFSRNILNPFVGGGTNWMVLTAQKMGIDFISPTYYAATRRKVDVASESGMKELEDTLFRNLRSNNTNIRFAVGSVAALLSYALIQGTGADETYEEWLKKNPWAKKYVEILPPPAFILMLKAADDEMADYFSRLFGRQNQFNEMDKLIKGVGEISGGILKDDDPRLQKGLGKIGDLVGSKLSIPVIPWRYNRDIKTIVQGAMGKPVKEYDWNAVGWWNGLYKGGLVEQLGARPDKKYNKNLLDIVEDNKPLQAFVYAKRLRLESGSDISILNERGFETSLKDAQVARFEKEWSKYISDAITPNIAELNKLSEDELKSVIGNIKSVAKSKALNSIGTVSKEFSTFTEGDKYLLNPEQISYRKEVKYQYLKNRGERDFSIIKTRNMRDGLPKWEAEIVAEKWVQSKANDISKEKVLKRFKGQLKVVE